MRNDNKRRMTENETEHVYCREAMMNNIEGLPKRKHACVTCVREMVVLFYFITF